MKKRYPILLGMLLLVAIGKWTIWSSPDPTQIATPTELSFQCLTCQHDWQQPTAEAADWYPGGMANDHTLVPCVACAKTSALLKRSCLWCKNAYVPSAATWRAQMDGDPKTDVPEICPHCQKDVLSFPRPK